MAVPKDEAKSQIHSLLVQYFTNKEKYRNLSETDTRIKFIDRLFEYLGWDMLGERIPDEVHREEGIKTKESGKKKADYTFRINGITRLVVEAKALGETVDDDIFVNQAVNYAYNKACSWAVLTNFKTIRVFHVGASGGTPFYRMDFFSPEDSDKEFETLWHLSRESVLGNSLELEAKRRGLSLEKIPIDQQLLSDLKNWREILSKDIRKKYGREYESHVIDEIVQRIIDRLIFIRKTEDSKLEEPNLQQIIRRFNRSTYDEIKKVFVDYREKYNSKLFGENDKTSHESDKIELSNEVIEEVIRETYQPKNTRLEYDFSVIDADILGSIYEQYLAYVLSQTPRKIKLEGGIAHRKEQGIYYTPTQIVEYIVNSTLGRLLQEMKLAVVKDIRVLDPACGSGSFLIKAYDAIDAFYRRGDKESYEQIKFDSSGGLPFSKKVEILQNNIFGVDLDSKAIEISQLNLLMKIAERGHRLPILQRNIKCGNSIIESSESSQNNSFDWKKEFSTILDAGGFDVVIGNPPYIRQEEFLPIKPYLEKNYEVYHSMADLFVYFFEREIKLLKTGGYFGMIVSNKWLKAGYGMKLREFLSKYWIEQFVDFGDLKLFQDATTYPCIIIIKKISKSNPKMKVCQVTTLNYDSLRSYVENNSFLMNQSKLNSKGWNMQVADSANLLERIKKNGITLGEYVKGNYYRGILTGFNEAFVIDDKTKNQLIEEDAKSAELIKPFLTGNEVRKYGIKNKGRFIILTKIGVDIKRYPAILRRLNKYKEQLEKRWDKGNYWYELRSCDYYDLFEKPKIMYGKITTQPRFTIDYDGYLVNDSNFFFPFVDKKLLGILNSKLGWYMIKNTCTQVQGGYQLIWKYFSNVIIATKDSTTLEKLVDKALSINKSLQSLGDKNTDETEKLNLEFNEVLDTIDQEIYHLYGLSQSEVKILERSVP
ncbi:MAG: Eco57I restriction-modification methylase domain-containing protein [Nitrososphaerales archaeon]